MVHMYDNTCNGTEYAYFVHTIQWHTHIYGMCIGTYINAVCILVHMYVHIKTHIGTNHVVFSVHTGVH